MLRAQEKNEPKITREQAKSNEWDFRFINNRYKVTILL